MSSRNARWAFSERVRRGAGGGGCNVSRDDCEYVGVGKNDGLSVVLLTGAADPRIRIVGCRRPSTTSCMVFCCSGLYVSSRFGSSITFDFDARLVCALLAVGPTPAKYGAPTPSGAIGRSVSRPSTEHDDVTAP